MARDRRADVAERRRHDHRQLASCSRSLLQELDAVHLGHLEVGHHDVRRLLGGDPERVRAAFRRVDLVALLPEQLLEP